MPVHVEGLGWPEEEHGEEVCAGDKGDDQCESEDARVFLEAGGEHGPFRAVNLPEGETDEKGGSEKEGDEGMDGFPRVLFQKLVCWIRRRAMGNTW